MRLHPDDLRRAGSHLWHGPGWLRRHAQLRHLRREYPELHEERRLRQLSERMREQRLPEPYQRRHGLLRQFSDQLRIGLFLERQLLGAEPALPGEFHHRCRNDPSEPDDYRLHPLSG